MFSEEVLNHFQNPRNTGDLPDATARAEVSNPVCGDVLQLAVRVENDRIAEARFLCRGCTTAIACGSFVTELMLGKNASELQGIDAQFISRGLGGLPQSTFHGAQLAGDALSAISAKVRGG